MIALALLQSAGSAATIANFLPIIVIGWANEQLTTLKTGDQALSKENP